MLGTKHLQIMRQQYGDQIESRAVTIITDKKHLITLGKELWAVLDYFVEAEEIVLQDFYDYCARQALWDGGLFVEQFPFTIERAIQAGSQMYFDVYKDKSSNDNLRYEQDRNVAWIIPACMPGADQKALVPGIFYSE